MRQRKFSEEQTMKLLQNANKGDKTIEE